MRNQMTPAEKMLWFHLKGRRLNGYKFRRQQSIGKYIVDFYCPKYKLAIGIDGDSHNWPDVLEYDQRRQTHIESLGITVLRFNNPEIYSNLSSVLDCISKKLNHP